MTWFAILPLATGAGLVGYIVAHISLLLGIACMATLGLGAGWLVWHVTPETVHSKIKSRLLVGLCAGLLGTFSYDIFRYSMVTLLHYSYWPFETLRIFGQLLVGENAPSMLTLAAGVLYHFANGIGFGIAFVFLFKKPNIVNGIAWAMVLELCMVSLFPGWLGLKALSEFLSVSVLGHVVYGTVLGGVTQHRLTRNDVKVVR